MSCPQKNLAPGGKELRKRGTQIVAAGLFILHEQLREPWYSPMMTRSNFLFPDTPLGFCKYVEMLHYEEGLKNVHTLAVRPNLGLTDKQERRV